MLLKRRMICSVDRMQTLEPFFWKGESGERGMDGLGNQIIVPVVIHQQDHQDHLDSPSVWNKPSSDDDAIEKLPHAERSYSKLSHPGPSVIFP